MEAQGHARVAQIQREASERIAELRAEHEAEAVRRRTEMLRREEAERRAELAVDLAKARAEARRRVLEARDDLLERVFACARELLGEAIGRPAARARLASRLREALELIPPGAAVVTCSPDVASALEDQLRASDDVRIEPRPELPPGFRVSGAGGALVVDATLEKLLELERPRLAIEVLHRLAETTP